MPAKIEVSEVHKRFDADGRVLEVVGGVSFDVDDG